MTIHTLEEREPIPTFMKKVPVCLTYAFFVVNDKCYMLMDPTDKEERVSNEIYDVICSTFVYVA